MTTPVIAGSLISKDGRRTKGIPTMGCPQNTGYQKSGLIMPPIIKAFEYQVIK
jgi:hypothetical protein